jgi:predicted negative regulator of RcsB-dependent stress response
MAKRKPQSRGPREPEEILGAAQQALNYLRPFLKWIIAGTVAVAVVLLAWSGYTYLQHSRETRAQTALDKARPKLSQPDQAEEAIKALNTLIQEYPSTRAAQMARLFKAHLLYQTQKYADAAKIYEEVRGALGPQDPDAWSPFVTESLSYCYEAQGDYAKAAQTLKPLADQAGGSYQAIILAHLALLYDKAGNPKEAGDIWQRLLAQTQNPALKAYWKGKLAADKAAPEKTPGKN